MPNRDVSLAKSMEVRREHCPKRNATFCSKSRDRFRSSGDRERGLQSVLNKSEPSLLDSGGGVDGSVQDRLQGPLGTFTKCYVENNVLEIAGNNNNNY